MTDPRIEAVAEAAWCAAYHWPNGWSELVVDNKEHWRKIARAALEAAEQAAWRPIAEAPDDRQVAVWCPAREGLDELMTFARHHPDAGFCVDAIREPTHFRIVEPPR